MSMFDPTPENQPTATFHLDQADAANEMATRDEQNWLNHLEVHAQNVDHAKAMAERHRAVASLTQTAASALALAGIIGTLHGLRRLVRR